MLTSAAIVFLGGAIVLVRVLADVWPQHTLDLLEYEHELTPTKTVVGEHVEARLSLWNRSRLPIAWAVAEDTLSEHLAAPGSVHSDDRWAAAPVRARDTPSSADGQAPRCA